MIQKHGGQGGPGKVELRGLKEVPSYFLASRGFCSGAILSFSRPPEIALCPGSSFH